MHPTARERLCFVRILPISLRLAFAAAGLAALIPASAFPGAVWTDVVGVLAGAGLIGWELAAKRRAMVAG